ncbi:hypothetical protein ZWY2020_013572 [Hordeum vulgare]|nr:hypothetical protein ZWY2020_013572 [Hordeum vulgare]
MPGRTRAHWEHHSSLLYVPGGGRNPRRSFPGDGGSVGSRGGPGGGDQWWNGTGGRESDRYRTERAPTTCRVALPIPWLRNRTRAGTDGRGDTRGPRLHVPSPSPIPFRRWEPPARPPASGGRPTPGRPGTPRSRAVLLPCSATFLLPYGPSIFPWSSYSGRFT